MKIERDQHGGDDTSLNAIKLTCETREGSFGGDVSSTEGLWGDWVGSSTCSHSAFHGKEFLKSFALQIEPYQHGGDDTEANYVKFMCQDFESQKQSYELARPPGHGFWGSYGSWSDTCGPNSAICGIQTKVEDYQKGDDDTSLNDVIMLCCSD